MRLQKKSINFKLHFIMSENSNKVIKVVLECIKLVVTALIGYFGGNAVM